MIKTQIKTSSLFIILLLFSAFTRAQNAPENEVRKIIDEATNVISPYLDTVPQLSTTGNNNSALLLMNRSVFKRSSSSLFSSEYNLQKSKVLRNDWGIDLNANYIENVKNGDDFYRNKILIKK